MTTRRFAEDTKVAVGRSLDEVKVRLRTAGAAGIAVFERPERSAVIFEIGTGQYRITVPMPTGKNAEQEHRRAWRLVLLLVKAKLEAIREGASTVEREFFADRVLHDGRTASEYFEPQIEEARRLGRMPTALLLEGPK